MKRFFLILLALLLVCSSVSAAQQLVTVGTSGSKASLDTNFGNIQSNFTEVYGHKVSSGSITGDNLTLVLADASTIVVDVSTLLDNTDAQTVTAFSLNSTTNILTLTLSGGNTSTVDLSDLVSAGGATAINDLTDVDTTGKEAGKVLKFDASLNLVVGDDEIGAAGTGDITGVTAGTGLTGGGDTGAVTIGLSAATSEAIAANTAAVGAAVDLNFSATDFTLDVTNPLAPSVSIKSGVYEPADPTIVKEAGAGTVFLAPDGDASGLQNLPSGSFAFDTFPVYEDSAHTSGVAVNATTLAVYSSAASKWMTASLTDTLDPTPITPTLSTWAISSNGETVTATLSESCVSTGVDSGTWTLNCTETGPLDLGEPTGLPGTDLTWTAIGGPVLSDVTDTECLVYYTVGANVIEDADGDDLTGWATGVAVTNGSTETGGGGITTLYPTSGESASVTTYPSAMDDYLAVNDSDNATYGFVTADFMQFVPTFNGSACTSISTLTVHTIMSSSSSSLPFRFLAEGTAYASDFTATTTPTEFSHTFVLNPAGGVAWTCAAISTLTAGTSSRGISGAELRTHEVWVTYE